MPEGGAVDLDRRACLFRHPLPDAARLKDRDAVSDDEGAGGLVGRVKEYRAKIPIFGLQPADDGIAPSDVDEALAIDVERDGCQGLLPGALGVTILSAVNITRDPVPGLAHDHDRGAPPAFDRKRHHNGVAEPGPAPEAATLRFKIERPLRNQFVTRERRDESIVDPVFSPAPTDWSPNQPRRRCSRARSAGLAVSSSARASAARPSASRPRSRSNSARVEWNR